MQDQAAKTPSRRFVSAAKYLRLMGTGHQQSSLAHRSAQIVLYFPARYRLGLQGLFKALVFLVAVLAACQSLAQRCSSNLKVGCTDSGAVCSPVTTGAGSTGVCTTPSGFPPGEKECECAGLDLTGTWAGNDGAIYYLRQTGHELWWAGLSVDSPEGVNDLNWGIRFANVFHGQISNGTVTGDWADVPRGAILNSGTLSLAVSANLIQRQSETGGFGATSWNRIARVVPSPDIPPATAALIGTDIYAVFALVKKNQNAWRDHSLLDNLKPAKSRPVAIFGNIVQTHFPDTIQVFPQPKLIPGAPDPDPMHVNYPARADRCYATFICLNGNDSPPDGDIDFNLAVDRANLDAQIGFWSGNDWETNHGVNAGNFRAKLENGNDRGQKNQIHLESIMYGGTTECGDQGNPEFLLPGWQQSGAQGVLLNGRPIGGQMDFSNTGRPDGSSTINSILGRKPRFGDRVRVTGILGLDCGHGIEHDCDEDTASTQNQEIHPIYAIDFVQNFAIRKPTALLTGAWASDDAGTYYVHQVGNTVWWLGLSVDEGLSFANIFHGTLQGNQVSGSWADVPLGQTSGLGQITVNGNQGQGSTVWSRLGDAGGFAGSSWQKLYDAGEQRLVIVFEGATATSAVFPSSPEPFEIQVGNQRVEAKPANPRPVAAPKTKTVANASRSSLADLGVRVPFDPPPTGGVYVASAFAGHRASWTIPQENLKPGEYTQMLTPPKTPRLSAPLPAQVKGQVVDRDAHLTAAHTPAPAVPRITIHYRIEAVESSEKERPGVTTRP